MHFLLRRLFSEKSFGILIGFIILCGIVLRLVLFFQNRNLIIDEANIVRNLAERNYPELLKPLKYEQYAPPVFLWIEKTFSLIFGFGEKALRLYPLICGIASLFVFRAVMKKLVSNRALWLPLAMMAFSPLFIEYSASLKQYMPDAFIALLLVYAALSLNSERLSPWRLMFYWCGIGGIAIVSSMPSVFVLAGVGIYFFAEIVKGRKWDFLSPLLLTGLFWIASFGIYYWVILKPQIESTYLQNYHASYFLFALPTTVLEWEHNWMRIKEIIENVAGYTAFNLVLSLCLLTIGTVRMIRTKPLLFVLLTTPFIFTLFAAALHQFSLLDRVVLFLIPLLLMVYGFGLESMFLLPYKKLQPLYILIGVIAIASFNMFWIIRQKWGFHEITEGMDFLIRKHVKAAQLYVHDASAATLIYYTELHPDKKKYHSLQAAHKMKWNDDYSGITESVEDTVYFLYTGGFTDAEREKRTAEIEQNLQQIDYFEKYTCFVYGYAPRNKTN